MKIEEVSLTDMLDARERRAALQRELLSAHRCPLVCLTLNIPGPVKVLELVPQAFEEGERRIREALSLAGLAAGGCREIREKTGYEAFFWVDGDPLAIKRAVSAAEDKDRLGRLFDIDVIRPDGEKVSREDLGLPPRTCLLCGQPAHACSRSRSHSVAELVAEIQRILAEKFG